MDERPPATVLALHGRLVESTIDAFEPMLAGLLVVDRPRLVVDLSQVAVCDTAGAALLASVARMARERGGELRLAAPSPAVCPWLRRAGAMIEVATFASVDSAVEADEIESPDPVPCVETGPTEAGSVEAWPRPRVPAVFGVSSPLWRVRSSARVRSRRGPASPRR